MAPACRQCPLQLKAAGRGHEEIRDHTTPSIAFQTGQKLACRLIHARGKTLGLQQARNALPDEKFIIHNRYLRLRVHCTGHRPPNAAARKLAKWPETGQFGKLLRRAASQQRLTSPVAARCSRPQPDLVLTAIATWCHPDGESGAASPGALAGRRRPSFGRNSLRNSRSRPRRCTSSPRSDDAWAAPRPAAHPPRAGDDDPGVPLAR